MCSAICNTKCYNGCEELRLPQVAASLIRLRPLLPHVLDDIEKGPHLQTEHALISLNNTLQGCLENALSMAEAQMNVVMTARSS